MKPPEPGRPLRFVSAASLFDGHDAAINMIRRLLQSGGAEVVHLGHNRSVADIVSAAIAEDADAIAVSSYQGGHNEYFRYMIDMLRELGAEHIKVVVGGGGTISPGEIAELEKYGVAKIYTPEDGRRLGLTGMIEDVFTRVGRRVLWNPEMVARDSGSALRAVRNDVEISGRIMPSPHRYGASSSIDFAISRSQRSPLARSFALS